MKKAVFWDVALCRCLLASVLTVSSLEDFLFFSYPEDGGDVFLRNIC
jgi:hypothetical protein